MDGSSSDSVKIQFITPRYFDAAVKFACEMLIKTEPLCKSLNLNMAPNAALDYFVRNSIEQGNSVMAIDTAKDDQIVGVRVHRTRNRVDDDPVDPHLSQTEFDKVIQLVHFCHTKFDPFSAFDVDVILDCTFICVLEGYRGRNLGLRMMEFTFDFMRREKIPVCVVLVSGKFSRAIMEKLGFKVQFEMNYEDYKVNDKQVFYPEAPHKGFALMAIRL